MSSTLRLKDIAHDVSRDNPDVKLARESLEILLASAFKVILERAANGERVHIMNFGSFRTSVYKGRSITSPMLDGKTVTFGDRQVLRFHMAPNAKETIAKLIAPPVKSKKDKPAKEEKESATEAPSKKKKVAPAKAEKSAKKKKKKVRATEE